MRLSNRARLLAVVGALALTSTAFADGVIINGTDGNDTINGTAASESIYGRDGNDTINGGGGDDEIDGGFGADVMKGGDGTDVVVYSGDIPIVATIDGIANDGGIGNPRDNIALDVEDLYGGDGDDNLTGSDGPNTIDGGTGGDRIKGGAGADTLIGGEGDDVIDAQDGEIDRIECGPGNDTAAVDLKDILVGDCEKISKPQVTITPGLTLNTRTNKLIVSTIQARSSLTLACVSGCHPKTAPTKAVIRKRSVTLKSGVARFTLPKRIRGATIELGVTAPGATPFCRRYKLNGLRSYKVLRGQACTTVAKGT